MKVENTEKGDVKSAPVKTTIKKAPAKPNPKGQRIERMGHVIYKEDR